MTAAEVQAPRRIQLSRKKGYRKPAGAVVVSRPSKWGNPFKRLDVSYSRDGVVARYRFALESGTDPRVPVTVAQVMAELRGKDLACWCPLDQPCHADVLLEIANR